MKANGQAMNNDVQTTARRGELNWLLDDLIQRLAGAEQAVVLSSDGLLLGRSAAMDREDAEHLAAMASAFGSLSRSAGLRFGKGAVLQTVVELHGGFLVVTEAGEGACLALLASAHADLGMLAYEMNVLVERVGRTLSASPRELTAEPRSPLAP
jgi:predicted regulator of Ras-like GTPase activity (Roadblock/LC7/MglB family)